MNIPTAEQIRRELAPLTTLQRRHLAVLCALADNTVKNIATGRTSDPGVDTCRLLLKHLPAVKGGG